MIRYTEHNNIDKEKWDKCIEKSAAANIFVHSWYLDVVCENWSALILNDYEAVFPVASRSKYKISYLYQPFFTRYFGVYTQGKASVALTKEFLSAIPEKFRYMEFCLYQDKLDAKSFEIKERLYQKLDLAISYEGIRKGYSENAVRSIKKSIKAGLTIREGIAPEMIVSLFRTTKGDELEVFKPNDYKVLIRLMKECLSKGKGRSVAVYDGETLSAAAFFMESDQRFIYLKSGITEEGKAKGAMYYLIDHVIKENCGRLKELDFGGSSVENIARFYKKFGAKDCVYLQLKKNTLPGIVNWVRSLKS